MTDRQKIRLEIASRILAATILKNDCMSAHDTMNSETYRNSCLDAAEAIIKLNEKKFGE